MCGPFKDAQVYKKSYQWNLNYLQEEKDTELKHRLPQELKKCLFFLNTFIKFCPYDLPTDFKANLCPDCLWREIKYSSIFFRAWFENPSLKHFQSGNDLKLIKSQVLKS